MPSPVQMRFPRIAFAPASAHPSGFPSHFPRIASRGDACVARGAVIHRGLLNEEYGYRDFTVLTPMGHRLTFGMPLFKE